MPRKKIETRVKEAYKKLQAEANRRHITLARMRADLKDEENTYLALEQTLLVLEELHPEVKDD